MAGRIEDKEEGIAVGFVSFMLECSMVRPDKLLPQAPA
jgi:hypothetical protein